MAEFIVDGGFENWSASNNLTSWGEDITGSSTLANNATEKYSGNYSAKITLDSGANYIELTSSTFALTTGPKRIRIQRKAANAGFFWALTTTGANTIHLDANANWVAGYGWNTPAAVADWTEFSLAFNRNESYNNYYLSVGGTDVANAVIYIDEANVEDVETETNPIILRFSR